jgi:Type IV secretion system pilin
MTKSRKFFGNLATVSLGLLLGMVLITGFSASPKAYADVNGTSNVCKPGVAYDPQKPCIPDPNDLKSTPDSAAKTCSGGDCSGLITKYVNPAIRLLSGLVGVLVTISIVVAGIQYASAGGDPSKVVAARKRITNAILALLAYLFMFAFLQWLIPGGII